MDSLLASSGLVSVEKGHAFLENPILHDWWMLGFKFLALSLLLGITLGEHSSSTDPMGLNCSPLYFSLCPIPLPSFLFYRCDLKGLSQWVTCLLNTTSESASQGTRLKTTGLVSHVYIIFGLNIILCMFFLNDE